MKRGLTYVFLVIPFIYLALYTYFIQWNGPFFATRIDPEYPYLLNGLNAAQLLFGQIGHVHHPGTPFQIFNGIVIRITHLFAGRGDILFDVFKRPEFYLSACSHVQALLLTGVLFWVGKLGWQARGLVGMLAMQLSPFFSSVALQMSLTRNNPDRLVVTLILIICGLTLHELFSKENSSKKYAIWSGAFSAVALCSKISCMPVLLIPFIVSKKHKWIYALTTVVVFVLCIIPVASRVRDFLDFTEQLASHDGLYGGGERQFFNMEAVLANLSKIIEFNVSFVWIWVLSLVSVVLALIKKNYDRRHIFLSAFIIAGLGSSVLVAKHFKNYYLAPMLVVGGLALVILFTVWEQGQNKKKAQWGAVILILILLISPQRKFWTDHMASLERQAETESQVLAFASHRGPNTDVLIDPSWESTPFVENGISFGVSYVRHHDRYAAVFDSLFTHVITYEGTERPLKRIRVVEFDQAEVYNAEEELLFYGRSKDRFAEIFDFMKTSSASFGVTPQADTLEKYRESAIIKITFEPLN